jgi:hypothetical protein
MAPKNKRGKPNLELVEDSETLPSFSNDWFDDANDVDLGHPNLVHTGDSFEQEEPEDSQPHEPITLGEQILRSPPQEQTISWDSKPSFVDQFVLKPETCKMGPLVTKVFDLTEAGDIASFNDIHSRAYPEGAPQLVIMREQIVPFDTTSTFKAILQYRAISYMVLQKI